MGTAFDATVIQNLCILFPLLASDSDFKITSPDTPNYNCIAWAYGSYQDRWMQACPHLDGTWWPDGVTQSSDISAFIEAFEKKGYSVCDNHEHEEGHRKIALYVNERNECTHAARELTQGNDKGKWTSKMGQEHDIRHGSPFVLEGNNYGRIHCFMKCEFK